MQVKYITQIKELFDDFHLVTSPLLDEEVRRVDRLRMFGKIIFD